MDVEEAVLSIHDLVEFQQSTINSSTQSSSQNIQELFLGEEEVERFLEGSDSG